MLSGAFDDADEPTLRDHVAKALFAKSLTRTRLGRSAEELAVYNDLIARFGDADEPTLRGAVLRARRAREGQDDK